MGSRFGPCSSRFSFSHNRVQHHCQPQRAATPHMLCCYPPHLPVVKKPRMTQIIPFNTPVHLISRSAIGRPRYCCCLWQLIGLAQLDSEWGFVEPLGSLCGMMTHDEERRCSCISLQKKYSSWEVVPQSWEHWSWGCQRTLHDLASFNHGYSSVAG